MTNKDGMVTSEDAEKRFSFLVSAKTTKSFYQLQKQKHFCTEIIRQAKERALQVWKNFINPVKNLRREISFT